MPFGLFFASSNIPIFKSNSSMVNNNEKQKTKNEILIFMFNVNIFKGLVIDFMSVPVNAGFTSAAAITIASSQVSQV